MTRLVGLVAAAALSAACHMPPDRFQDPPASTYDAGARQVRIGDASESMLAAAVSPEFFEASGVRPMLGRTFIENDYAAGGVATVVLAHDLWAARFESSPEIIGRQLEIDGRQATVVGVMPAGFRFPGETQLWVPGRPDPGR